MTRAMREIAVVAAAALLAWVMWLLVRAPAPSVSDGPRGAPASQPPATAPGDTATTGATAALTTTRRGTPILVKPFQADAANEPPTDSHGIARTLTVVETPDDRLAIGAVIEVFLIDRNVFRTVRDPIGDKAQRAVATLVADEHGVVTLPPFRDVAGIRGSNAGRIGQMLVDGERSDELRLRLSPRVSALVVNARGAPQAGVDIALSRTDDHGHARTVSTATTGADGIVILTTAPAEADGGLPPVLSPTATLTTRIAVTQQATASFSVDAIPAEAVRLVIPVTGSLRVRISGPDGKPFLAQAAVMVGIRDESAPPTAGRNRAWKSTATELSTGGVAVFTCVGLGEMFGVVVTPLDGEWVRATGNVTGPTDAAKEAVGDVTLSERAVVVSGRLVNPAGTPLPRAQIHAVVGEAGRLPVSSIRAADGATWTTTRTDGRFRFAFSTGAAALATPAMRIDCSHAGSDASFSEPDPSQFATVPLPESCKTGPVDVGDVIAPEGVIAVAGIVVDVAGTAIADAQVYVERQTGARWEQAPELARRQNKTGASGAFAIHGSADAGALRVRARKEGLSCNEPVEFAPGAHGVRVTLSPPTAIAGSFRAPPGGRARPQVSIRISDEATLNTPEGQTRQHKGATVRADGTWLTEVKPGMHRVEILRALEMKPALVVDVVVVAGAVTRDPRLQDVDLSAGTSTFVVTVVDDADAPIPDVALQVQFTQDGRSSQQSGHTDASGRDTVSIGVPAATVSASHPGYRSARMSNVSSDITLKLLRAQPQRIAVTLDAAIVVPAGTRELCAFATWLRGPDAADGTRNVGDNPGNSRVAIGVFAADRTATIEVTDPGVYEVRLGLCETSSKRPQIVYMGGRGPAPSARAVGGVAATVTLKPDAAEIAKVIAAAATGK